MQTTTNYGLKTYQAGDLFNPLTTDNVNMETIDTDLKAVSDRAIGRATELVSQGVHAITVLDADCKTIKWVATANFTAGETFTVNGIQCNAYLPSGEALGSNAYVSGAQVIGSLNNDNSAMTIYVPQGSVAVASDSERLGGELPAYYATKTYADGIKTTAESASRLIQKKALVNTYYNSSDKKLYQVNSDGTQGGEIIMGIPALDYANPLYSITATGTYTASKDCYLCGQLSSKATTGSAPSYDIKIDGTSVLKSSISAQVTKGTFGIFVPPLKISTGSTVTVTMNSDVVSSLEIYDVI